MMRNSNTMRTITSSALMLASALALGACGPVNRALASVNQPVVQRTDYVFDLAPGPIGPMNRQRLATWLDSLHLGYGDRVSVDDRNGDAGARAAVAALIAEHGLTLAATAPATPGAGNGGGTRVIVSRSTAHVPNCPNWDRASTPEFAGSTMSNYGCATNHNLAAMIANPADLIKGVRGAGSDPDMIARAIKTYREKEPTGAGDLKQEKTRSSNSSGGGDN